ncbi:MAG: hypothetical protein K9M54_08350 [Kiritimatiellales bacterium]|nr:hypothetical protein [Kiritimatiellales bacterium]
MRQLSLELKRALKPLETKLKLMWVGVFPSFGIYVFLASNRAARGNESAITSSQMMPIVVFLTILVLVMSFVQRWFTLSPQGIVKVLDKQQPGWLKAVSNPDSSQSRAILKQEYLDALDGDELKLYEYSSCLYGRILVQWGLVNTCALFGMILPPIQYQPFAAIVAAVVSSVSMFFHYPNIGSSFAAGLELFELDRGINRSA